MSTKTFFAAGWLWLSLCFFSKTLFCQSQIAGKIAENDNQPLGGASVLLLKSADSSLIKGQLSALDGDFRFEEIATGDYFLKVTMLGFEDFQSENFSLAENPGVKTFPVFVLSENSKVINEVQVVAKKPFFEQKIDRLAINVAASGVNAGGNALQVLSRSPGVLVNKQSNSISMSGKFGVIIMINGKISRMPPDAVLTMLEGMSSENIERIELIHTPPASFDAEGNAGIINIVLKQSGDAGLNGNYSVNAGHGKQEKYGGSTNLNFRKKRVNLFGNYSYAFDNNPQVFTNYRGFRDSLGRFVETDGSSDRSSKTPIQNARLGADFQVSKKTVLGVVGTYFKRNWEMLAGSEIDNRINKTTDYRVKMITKEINTWESGTGNLNFSHQFTPQKTLTMDADFVFYKIHNPSSYDIQNLKNGEEISTFKRQLSKETPIKIGVAKADFTQNFKNGAQFETGLKATRSLFDNDVLVESLLFNKWTAEPEYTSHFKLMENVAAAYASVSFKMDAKTDLKMGLRYEFTETNLGSEDQPNVVDRKYGSFFPSIYVSRKISEVQNLNISFSRRIQRPGFTQLAPYLIFYDPTTVQGGNPSLQPSFVNAMRTDYRFKVFSLTLEYNHESPSIRDVPFVNFDKNTQITRPENIGKTHTAYGMLNFPWQPAKWWEMQSTVFYAWQLFNVNYEGSKIDVPTRFVGFNNSQTFRLPHKFSFDISAFFITANNSGIVKYNANGTLNFGLQKDLGERWGKLTLNLNDIFQSNNYFWTADQPELNLLVKGSFQQAERVFMLTWANKFGNKKLKDARQRQSGAADEMRRL